jgi:hypothetical protein
MAAWMDILDSVKDGVMNTEVRIVGDHYAVISNGQIVGIVRKESGADTWGWFPIRSGGSSFRFVPVEDALRAGVRDAERS